jgi:leader peptidase (prepilin peptidase)/N-methyltransferase
MEFAAWLLAAADIREPLVPLWALEFAFDVFLGAWLFCVGACVGSFLNVVVYRLPRGMNLLHPASRCPSCLHPIRLRDNIPLLSWLLLGGKCRDCRAPVSSRYFWVELAMGSVFLGLWLLEANLPRDLSSESFRRSLSPFDVVPFWTAYGLHVLLLATILGGALIHADGFRTPPLLFLPILLAGLILPLFWPEIRRLPAWSYAFREAWQQGAMDGLVGIAAGAALAAVSLSYRTMTGRGWPAFAPVALMAALGAVLGWQYMLLAAPVVMLLYVAAAFAVRLLRPLPEPEAITEMVAADHTPSIPIPADPDIAHEPNQPPV